MATPKKQSNGTYLKRFRYKDVTGEWKNGYIYGKKASECEAKYIRFMADLDSRAEMRKVNIGQLYEMYIESAALKLKHSSLKSASDVIRLHILPYFEKRQLASLTLHDIERWKEVIESKGYRFKYKTKIYCAFTAMINYAMKRDLVTRNVVSLAGDFKNDEIIEAEPFWTLDDFKKVYAVIDEPTYRAYYSFLFFTGCRKNEATCLTWKDFEKGFVAVKFNKTLNRKGCANGATYEITSPKTKRSNRLVLLPNCLIQELKTYRKYCEDFDGFSEDCFVFGIKTPLVEQTIRRKLDEYAIKAGVCRIKVHSLRHSHDSYLHDLGVNEFEIAAIAGRTVRVTTDTYLHTYSATAENIRARMDTEMPSPLTTQKPPKKQN